MPTMSVNWSGLAELKRDLHALPDALVLEAEGILLERAEAAKTAVTQAYPIKSGKLRKGLTLRKSRGARIAGVKLVQRAPHGHLYEYGTTTRQNKAGANRGQMAANPTFKPFTERHQLAAWAELRALLYRQGAASVTGDPLD